MVRGTHAATGPPHRRDRDDPVTAALQTSTLTTRSRATTAPGAPGRLMACRWSPTLFLARDAPAGVARPHRPWRRSRSSAACCGAAPGPPRPAWLLHGACRWSGSAATGAPRSRPIHPLIAELDNVVPADPRCVGGLEHRPHRLHEGPSERYARWSHQTGQ